MAFGIITNALELKGVFVSNKWTFQRALQGANKSDFPSEDFIFEPKYLVQLKDYFESQDQIIWE